MWKDTLNIWCKLDNTNMGPSGIIPKLQGNFVSQTDVTMPRMEKLWIKKQKITHMLKKQNNK